MINIEAFFKVTYGLFIVTSGDKDKGNGFISNTVMQVTATPACFAACCNKNNYTADFIMKTNHFAVSILQQEANMEIISRFGYKSGRDFNKLEGMQVIFGETGVPIVLNESIAYLECKVVQKVDVGTHWIFIGELLNAEVLNNDCEALTYTYYRQVKKGVSPKNAPTYIDPKATQKTNTAGKKYKCNVCGYIYDEAAEGKDFKQLGDDWHCPICGVDKSEFEIID